MDPDSSLPRSSHSYLLYFRRVLPPSLILFLLLVLSSASDAFAYAIQQTNSFENAMMAYPYPITTILIILLFLAMVIWLFARSRTVKSRKPPMKRWAG